MREVKIISSLEHGNIHKFPTTKVHRETYLKCTFPKIEKYIKIFENEILVLKLSKRNTYFPILIYAMVCLLNGGDIVKKM
jgi:hypothetical protein